MWPIVDDAAQAEREAAVKAQQQALGATKSSSSYQSLSSHAQLLFSGELWFEGGRDFTLGGQRYSMSKQHLEDLKDIFGLASIVETSGHYTTSVKLSLAAGGIRFDGVLWPAGMVLLLCRPDGTFDDQPTSARPRLLSLEPNSELVQMLSKVGRDVSAVIGTRPDVATWRLGKLLQRDQSTLRLSVGVARSSIPISRGNKGKLKKSLGREPKAGDEVEYYVHVLGVIESHTLQEVACRG